MSAKDPRKPSRPLRAGDEGMRHDLHDREIAGEPALGSKRDLGLIINTIPGMVWSATPDGAVDQCNRNWLDFAAMTTEQAKGWGWTLAIYPDDRDRLIECWRSSLGSSMPFEAEARVRRFDGAYRWFSFRANPLLDESGMIVRWYGTNIDIEDRKRAEELLRAKELPWREIVDNIPGLVHTTAATGEVEFLNRQVLEYFGKTPDELKDWSRVGIVHPDDLPRTIDAWRKSIETREPYEVEQRCRRADGVYRWFQARGRPVRNADDEITAWYWLLTDIEKRKRAEEALQSNERKLSLIINTMPTLAWSAHPDGSGEFFNQHYLDYVGLPLAQLQGRGWTVAVYPEDLNALSEAWQSIVAEGKPAETEVRLRRFDGQYRWFLIRTNPMRDESGNILKWYGINIDIEDRKRAEDTVRANEQALRSTINAIPALAWSSRPDGYVTFLNQRWLDYAGITTEQGEGWGWTVTIHPDDVSRLGEYWQAVLASGQQGEIEARLRRFDGIYRWFLFRATPLRDSAGNIVQWYGFNSDIDDRRRAEEQLKRSEAQLAEGQRLSRTGTFAWQPGTMESTWSKGLYRIHEIEPGTPISTDFPRIRVHPDDMHLVNKAIAGGVEKCSDYEHTHRIVMPDGRIKFLHVMARATRDFEGGLEYIGAVQDVTQRMLSEEAITKSRSELAHITRVMSLGILTASIAHEVNQPLAGIITNAETCLQMLDDNPPDIEGARETALRSIRDGNRASDVVMRLRSLFKKKDSVAEIFDLNEAAREVIALSSGEMRRNRVVLQMDLAEDLPPVNGDRVQLQQVIINLLRNAIDAMREIEDRPRQMVIETEKDGGGNVRLAVQDAGIGFAPDTADRLFESFYSTKNDGMGIGLAISRSIIEAHRGKIWATLNSGPGSTFAFSIPCGSNSA